MASKVAEPVPGRAAESAISDRGGGPSVSGVHHRLAGPEPDLVDVRMENPGRPAYARSGPGAPDAVPLEPRAGKRYELVPLLQAGAERTGGGRDRLGAVHGVRLRAGLARDADGRSAQEDDYVSGNYSVSAAVMDAIPGSVLHVTPPDWLAYGFVPIVLTLSIHDSVYFFLLVGAALSSMNSQLEEAAEMAGAGRMQVLRRIVFPLMLPSVLSGFILIFTKAVSSYGVPALLGTPVNFYMISTMLYSSMRSRLTTEANVLSLTLMLITMLAIYFNQRLLGGRRSYVTVTGKGSAVTHVPLGKWRLPAAVVLIAVVPFIVLLLQTFLLKDGSLSPDNFTLHYWTGGSDPDINTGEKGVLQNPIFLLALKNSLIIAGIASVTAAVIGLLFGYAVARGKNTAMGRLVDQLSFFPYFIPGISLAAIYITMFAKPVLFIPALYGTITIIILITVVKELPFTVKAGGAAMMQIGPELEEAAVLGGASWFTRFRRLLLPLSRKSLLSAFILVFIGAMKEMELIIMLLTNVVLMIIIAIVVAVYALAVKFGKADLTKGLGGQ
ncbi:hypothetical protein BGX30_006218 [Mortierella sp. GBA39]|nr:hypothetical protein BGX30_006218 [Mortierella sp. GBA39]